MFLLCSLIFIWSFLEASFWWVAPDIIIAIGYVYFPSYWKRFLVLGLIGAFFGSLTTYCWAHYSPDSWYHYVSNMRFHNQKNIDYATVALPANYLNIVKAAWAGIPYKLFFGVAPAQHIAFMPLILFGLLSRAIRFSFVLLVSSLIRFFSKPWSLRHPTKLSFILLLIWFAMIAVFDVVINQIVL